MNFNIKNKRALITGASRGIGMAIVKSLAAEGVKTASVSRTPISNDELNINNNDHISIELDLIKEGSGTELFKTLSERWGLPDIIIHNVGGNLDITDPLCGIEEWRKIYRFNLEIAIELNNLFIPNLISQKWGRIIHISSIASLENQGTVPYCSMKAALNAYTRSLGRFLSPNGISVSAVLPGAVFTEGGYWDKTLKSRPEHVAKYLSERMAINRFGKVEEISDFVTFLCSDQASFVVGSSFLVDGGQGRVFYPPIDIL